MIDNSINIFFNKVLFRFYVWKKKFEEDLSLLPGIHFYSWFCLVARNIDLDWWLHLVFYFIYIYIYFNNSFKILGNKPNIIISHS